MKICTASLCVVFSIFFPFTCEPRRANAQMINIHHIYRSFFFLNSHLPYIINVVIFTDALSVLSKLQNPCQKDLNKVETALVYLTAHSNLTLQWIPAHYGMQGNEQADQLDREASWNKRTDTPLTPMKRPSSKLSPRKKWKQQLPNNNQSDSLHKLNRPEQVILFRLRTGHNRLNTHMYNKFKVGESEMCPCNADIMIAEHLLQHC